MNQEKIFLSSFMKNLGEKKEILKISEINSIIKQLGECEKLICPICLKECSKPKRPNICEHIFCYTCISKWIKIKKCCPMCRRHIDRIIAI